MYTMKQACDKLGITYETLRFYCDTGLIPDVARDNNNYRMFDDKNIKWISSLLCLRKCGMSVKDMKVYMQLCLKGISSIEERQVILGEQKEILLAQIKEIQESIDFIDHKQKFYDDALAGKIEYKSNLIRTNC